MPVNAELQDWPAPYLAAMSSCPVGNQELAKCVEWGVSRACLYGFRILAAGVRVVGFPLVPMLLLRVLICNLFFSVSCIEIAPGSYVHEAAGLPRAACSPCKIA